MATLQKIRNRGGVLVSIVIGLALVAFIVGDALSSGASLINRSRNEVGEVGGESIGIQEYQQKIMKNEDFIKSMNGLSALTDDQQRMIRENTWNQIVSEIILNKEYEKLGLDVSGDELYDFLLGSNMNPAVSQLFADPNTGQVDKERARLIIKQLIEAPAGTPQKEYWLNMEEQVNTARKQEKYNTLLAKSLFVTDAQAKELAESIATTADISFIMKSYNTVSDSAVKVTANEIKDYYNSHKYLFEQEEARQIAYVNFDITASAEDIKETEDWVNDLKPEFAEAKNVLEFANLSSEKRFQPKYYKKGELNNEELDEFLFTEKSDAVFGPYLQDNAYNIVRVADRRALPDSVRARHILIASNNMAQSEKLADSLAGLIRKGGDFDALARQYSADQNTSVNGGDFGWFTQDQMLQPIADSAFFSNKNEVKVVRSNYGFHILQVTDKSKPVEKVQIGIVAKEITPSQQTINKIYNDARTFANNINTVEDFEAALTANNQTKRIANLGKNDYQIAGIDNAREIIREAYMAEEPGFILTTKEKSPIFEAGDKFSVVVLTGIQEEGIAPLNSVSTAIRTELIRKKKGEIIAKELTNAISGSESLLSVAQKANAEVMDATDVSFSSFQVPGVGIEPVLTAEVVTMKENEISKPIIGNQGVYVVVVNSKTVEAVTPEQIEAAKRSIEQTNLYTKFRLILPALVKNAGVVDTRYKFY
ncbi:MAG TPA: SurA N-terminal domain-containing protein [Candidatus Butyricimonas faecavium]|nr:SurA N-terminal domain-containing protein [Candidatus Butyricimonas faecavium]